MSQNHITERKAFLGKAYKQMQGDISKAVPYQQIADALHLHQDATAQVCVDLEGFGMIQVHSIPTVHIIRPDGHTLEQPLSPPGKLVSLTDTGVSYVQQYCQG